MKTTTSSSPEKRSEVMERPVRFLKLLRSSALWLSTILLLGAHAANAETLDGAKSAGQIGESVDGYVHLVNENAPADVKVLVKDINNKRRAKYASIAAKRGAPVADVAALAGAKLVERTPVGQYVMDSNAKWRKK
jgi:uncharacterized protein YdbL (DUF1318 family)